MAAPGFGAQSKTDDLLALSLSDKATICLELVKAYLMLHQQTDAEQLMKKTLEEFKGKLKTHFQET